MLDKIVSLRTRWLRDCREIIKSPTVRDNPILFSQNAGDIFRHNVMLGLIAWRRQLNPRSYFNEAIDDINQYCDALRNRQLPLDALPISAASLIAFLVDRDFRHSARADIMEPADLYLDCLIMEHICGNVDDSQVQRGIEKLAGVRRYALAVRSYEVYFSLLGMNKSDSHRDDLVSLAARNYGDRANDSFYGGGQDINGGGKYNDIVVDYRLAAILKHIQYRGEVSHSWKW